MAASAPRHDTSSDRPAWDLHEVAKLFAPDGPLARRPGFAYRPQQAAMAAAVAHALANGSVALIEAGTGTGKSLAYLVPSALFALSTGEKVVISTHTINLQEQLLEKDLPVVRELLGRPVRAVLVKGWRNYLCWVRLERARRTAGLWGRHTELERLADWAETSADGSTSDWKEPLDDAIWDLVSAEPDTCARQNCPHYARCFVFAARRQAAEAHLLVVNHHLLLADAALRRERDWEVESAVLPSFRHLVVDEAHQLDDVATQHFGLQVTARTLERTLQRLYRRVPGRGRVIEDGTVVAARRLAERCSQQGSGDGANLGAGLLRAVEHLLPAHAQATAAMGSFFGALAHSLQGQPQRGPAWRLPPAAPTPVEDVLEGPWPTLDEALTRLSQALEALKQALDELAQRGEAGSPDIRGAELRKEAALLAAECTGLADRLGRWHRATRFILTRPDPNHVYWIEERNSQTVLELNAAPLEVAEPLAEWRENALRAFVGTSATLTVNGQFDYAKGRLGLSRGQVALATHAFPSPFDWPRQARLGIATDLPDPTEPSFGPAAGEALAHLLVRAGGRALVLCTSYALLRELASRLEGDLGSAGIPLLVHGTAPRTVLLRRFREEAPAVLLGTDSFWEGVDVPGPALSLLVLTRLPFPVPSDPVLAARAEALKAAGREPFQDLSLPQAILKFKQGFGRLIRSTQDRGAAVVLDRRLWERRYGRAFLASLPPVPVLTGPWLTLATEVEAWLNG